MLKNRKLLILFFVFCLFVLLIGLFVGKKDRSQTALPSPNIINPQGDIILEENSEYQIVYLSLSRSYFISIKADPVKEVLKKAEQAFLALTKLTPTIACSTKVQIVTTEFVNPQDAGKKYRFSFCENLSAFPSVNPLSSPLKINKIYPTQGTVEIGNTNVSLFITFDKAIDITTALIEVAPNIPFKITTHLVRKDELIFTPDSMWDSNKKYTIKIKAGLTSSDTRFQLKEDVSLIYQTTEFVPPKHSEGGI